MKTYRLVGSWLILFLALAAPVRAAKTNSTPAAKHAAWKIEGPKCSVYLLGSVHVLKAEHYPLPAVFERAYTNARIVVFETDIGAMMKPQTQMQMMTKAQLPDGQTLKDVLSEPTYKDLSAYLKQSEVPEMMIGSMRPGMVVMMLAMLELQKLGYDPEQGMDLHFHQRATKDGKTERGLETVDFQLGLICDLSKAEGESLIKSTLRDMKDAKGKFAELITAWQQGDSAALEKLLNQARKDDPSVMKRFLTDRNAKWVPQIEELVKGTNNAVVIVGAGHLVGKDGVVDLLQQRGHKVAQE
jgi:uncharacterized protein YbaP (TraB family)